MKRGAASEWFGLAGLCYFLVGIFLLLCHKDESTPSWIWWVIFAASPLAAIALVAAQGVIMAACASIVLLFLYLKERFPNIFRAIGGIITGFYSGPHRFLDSEIQRIQGEICEKHGAMGMHLTTSAPSRKAVKFYEVCHTVVAAIQLFGTIALMSWVWWKLGLPVGED